MLERYYLFYSSNLMSFVHDIRDNVAIFFFVFREQIQDFLLSDGEDEK